MEAFPAHWEADVVLRDGGTAHLRPITPTDAEALQQFHVGQSAESIYLRFFAPMPMLSVRDLARFTQLDFVDRVAFVVTIGGAIIGVGRYDRVSPETAEVAFNVSDGHQGRGLGSVLLEHLAAAAREQGIRTFEAQVLPQNRRMLSVFRDAGYEVTHHYDDGVVTLRFAIGQTPRSLAVMESREHRSEARSVHALLNPTSIALIGVSRREATVGHRLLADLLAARFTGRLYVVHPKAGQVLGVPTWPRLRDIPEQVELAVIAVPAPAVLDVVTECAAKAVRALVVVSGGFAETGPQGLDRQRELVRLSRANGMRVVGPNSWGVVNTDPGVRLNISLLSDLPMAGRLGLFCQSGAVSIAVLDLARRRRIGVSTFLSAGNRADVSGNDCMQYWEEDGQTDVVALYLESIGNPRKFSRIARRLSRTKPVIVVKSGTSRFGVPPGHAVRQSRAPQGAFDAMLRQSGCVRVENVHQLFDVAQLLLHQSPPNGPRVAVVANSEALGALIADACCSWQLDVVHGPVAVPTMGEAAQFEAALDAAFADPEVDSVVAAIAAPLVTHATQVALALSASSARAGGRQPLVACLIGMPDLGEDPVARSAAIYPTPEEAVRALATATRYGAWRRRDPGTRVDPPGCDRRAAAQLVNDLLTTHPEGAELDPAQTARLLACYGIRLRPALGESSADEVFAGVACAISTVEDPLFGPVVSFGLSGDATELLGDVAHRIPPLTEVDIDDLVRSVRASPRLFGHRGAPPVDLAALHDVIARISCLADDLPEIASLDADPVIAAASGVSVLDAKVQLFSGPGRSDGERRELTML